MKQQHKKQNEDVVIPNRPRNFLVTDATQPFTFTYLQYGKPVSITVDLTAVDETWPGGSLWDTGVILAHVLVALAGFQSTSSGGTSQKHVVPPPKRLLEAVPSIQKDTTVLELGCGVGLTGIVAAAVLGTQLTILTDLNVVMDQVTRPNLEKNSTPGPAAAAASHQKSSKVPQYRLTKAGKRGRILAMPLCWGNEGDEQAVMDCFAMHAKREKSSARAKRKGAPSLTTKDPRQPDLIIIGDVAYQQSPGAPSHFDVLLSTLLKFLGPHTLVVFGTRLR